MIRTELFVFGISISAAVSTHAIPAANSCFMAGVPAQCCVSLQDQSTGSLCLQGAPSSSI